MKRILLFISLIYCMGYLEAQTVTDGFMMPTKDLCTGFMYGFDQWTHYWEGELKRDNGNIGAVTTQSVNWVGVYGITDKWNALVVVPYIWTRASQGTLTGFEGFQDISISSKYRFLRRSTGKGNIRGYGVITVSTPLTNYTPDLLPLSIGLASSNLSWRLNFHYAFLPPFYVNASGAYTWRSNVELDRSSYYTNNRLYLTHEVKMPNVFDYLISAGYRKNKFTGEINITHQQTLGGGDIRRQDMPFVSNRMNFIRIGALVIYNFPKTGNFVVRGGPGYILNGRNVGQSVSLSAGLLYTFHFSPNNE